MKRLLEFLTEGKKKLTNAGTVIGNNSPISASTNLADESLETLRRKLLDKFYKDIEESDKEKREVINKCVSTFVFCLDKKLRIDGDIIMLLCKAVNMEVKELTKLLTDETDKFYGSSNNLFGQTS
jgi:hypothetical protein